MDCSFSLKTRLQWAIPWVGQPASNIGAFPLDRYALVCVACSQVLLASKQAMPTPPLAVLLLSYVNYLKATWES